jgi:phage recombination protein Bet
MNQLVKYEYETDRGMVSLTPKTVRDYLVPADSSVTDQEVIMFLELCKYQKLNPFLREAYLVKYGNSPASIVTGKEVFTQRAQADPKFAGFEAGITIRRSDGKIQRRDGSLLLSNERLLGGCAKVYIKDYAVPLFDEVALAEYIGKKKDGTPTKMWTEKPATMIRKVALVHALREAFPDKFKGLYSQEEINTVDTARLPTNEVELNRDEEAEDEAIQVEAEVVSGEEDLPFFDPLDDSIDYVGDDVDQAEVGYEQPNTDPSEFVIGFGKHQGKTIGQIGKSDIGYVEWLSREGRDDDVRSACKEYLASIGAGTPKVSKAKTKAKEVDPIDLEETRLPFDI